MEITYQKVLLAVYVLSDERGLACDVPVARIAQECGHGIATVQRSIGMMIDRGVVEPIGSSDGLNRRILVLLDHPSARVYIADVKARIRTKRHEELRELIAKGVARAEARQAARDRKRR